MSTGSVTDFACEHLPGAQVSQTSAARQRSGNAILKAAVLIASLLESLLRYRLLAWRTQLQHHRSPTASERARWLHGCCRRIRRRMRLPLATVGDLPQRGLIVSNHLSHLDILFYGSLGPVIFVSKAEVRTWPLFGKLAAHGATVFVDRGSPAEAAAAAAQIEQHLRDGLTVLLFPEGTSGDGAAVLPSARRCLSRPCAPRPWSLRELSPTTPAARRKAHSHTGATRSSFLICLKHWGSAISVQRSASISPPQPPIAKKPLSRRTVQ